MLLPLRIENCTEDVNGPNRRYSARVDGELVTIVITGDCDVSAIGSAYLALALLEAMATGRSIEIDQTLPVNSRLLENLTRIQKVYCCWNSGLQLVSVHAQKPVQTQVQEGGLCFYSGGVDSNYSVALHMDSITHLMALNSFEGAYKESNWNQFVANQQVLSEGLDKTFLAVTGDFGDFTRRRKIARYFQHGLDMLGFASAMGFSVTYVPSTFSVDDVFPFGSHPVSDPLWGGADQRIEHDGCYANRSEKISFLKNYPKLVDNLQVCWAKAHENCGTCSKCVRTSLALSLLGMSCPRLPEFTGAGDARALKITGPASEPFIRELSELASRCGEEALSRTLKRKLWWYEVKNHVTGLVDLLTFGKLKAAFRNLQSKEWDRARVLVTSTNINGFDSKSN